MTAAPNPYAYLEPRVYGALGNVVDPELHRPLTKLNMVDSVEIDPFGVATVTIRLTTPGCPASRRIADDVSNAVGRVRGLTGAHVKIRVMSPEERAELVTRLRGQAASRGVPFGPDSRTSVFAIASGKGGVGKSTVT